jgi:adenine-specific DNA-methyltransferase
MSFKKITGSYYTPDHISAFIVNYIAKDLGDFEHLSILEPSIGEGTFIKAFNNSPITASKTTVSFTGIELIETELSKAKAVANLNPKSKTVYRFIQGDFLDIQKDITETFQLIIGNPPYISKKHLTDSQIKSIEGIHLSAGLSNHSIKNIWTAFLVKSCQLLSDDGIISFILPAEILQVSFAKELRHYISYLFERVEIFTFSELLFDCKGQDTVLLIAHKKHAAGGQFYTHIDNVKDLQSGKFKLKENDALNANNTKWSHHSLKEADLSFVYNTASSIKPVGWYCESKPGIVTAANHFFIINSETEQLYELEPYTLPIIQKGLFVNGSVVFSQNNFERLVQDGKPSKVLAFNDQNSDNFSPVVTDYLKKGESLEINERYKCQKRKAWYQIPNIAKAPDGFFFKRSHNYPKLLKNDANVLVTDSAYKIKMNEGFNINSFIYSFYNSLTLLFAELDGRYYGGGVLELIPSEFKNLPIPYVDISSESFNIFARDFENKRSILDVLIANDAIILGQGLGLNKIEIAKIQGIYNRLIAKRFRKEFTDLKNPIDTISL